MIILFLSLIFNVQATELNKPLNIKRGDKEYCLFKEEKKLPIVCKKLKTGCPVKLVCKIQSKELVIKRAEGVVKK